VCCDVCDTTWTVCGLDVGTRRRRTTWCEVLRLRCFRQCPRTDAVLKVLLCFYAHCLPGKSPHCSGREIKILASSSFSTPHVALFRLFQKRITRWCLFERVVVKIQGYAYNETVFLRQTLHASLSRFRYRSRGHESTRGLLRVPLRFPPDLRSRTTTLGPLL